MGAEREGEIGKKVEVMHGGGEGEGIHGGMGGGREEMGCRETNLSQRQVPHPTLLKCSA